MSAVSTRTDRDRQRQQCCRHLTNAEQNAAMVPDIFGALLLDCASHAAMHAAEMKAKTTSIAASLLQKIHAGSVTSSLILLDYTL